MSGIFDWSPRKSFWVWSTFGPGLSGIEDNLYFVDGVHPHPLPGPIAEKYQLHGYMATEYDPGMEFSHWEGSGYRRTAFFTKPVSSAGLPSELPDELSQDWVDYCAKFTASGRLKKEHRGL